MMKLFSLLALAMVLGCGSNDSGSAGGSGGTAGTGGTAGSGGTGGSGGTAFSADPPLTIGGERPAAVDIPGGYDPTVGHPLVVVLHGFGASGQLQAEFFRLVDMVDEKDLVMVMPDGTLNEDGERFWNGATFCCDPDDAIDDVAYLTGLIEEAKGIYNIDEKRVYLIGYSNGGFMSFRMACEASESITAIVSLAGSTFATPAECQPRTVPVSVLAVHGTADTTIFYDGVPDLYPGAVDSVEFFAAEAGCDTDAPTTLGNVNLIAMVDGDETEQVAYRTGCQEGIDAALWTIQDAPHTPFFYPPGGEEPAYADLVTDWLLEHSR